MRRKAPSSPRTYSQAAPPTASRAVKVMAMGLPWATRDGAPDHKGGTNRSPRSSARAWVSARRRSGAASSVAAAAARSSVAAWASRLAISVRIAPAYGVAGRAPRKARQRAARSPGGLPRVSSQTARAASASSTARAAATRPAPGPVGSGSAAGRARRLSATRAAHGSTKRRGADATRISSPGRTRPSSSAAGRASHTPSPALTTVRVPSANLSRRTARVTGSVTTTSRTSSSSVPAPTPSRLPRST